MAMAVSYKKLWHILLDKNMKKKELEKLAGISEYTVKRLTHDENITIDVLDRISKVLDCSVEDLYEIVDETGRVE